MSPETHFVRPFSPEHNRETGSPGTRADDGNLAHKPILILRTAL
jgi:hypothetical protein